MYVCKYACINLYTDICTHILLHAHIIVTSKLIHMQ